MQSAELRPVRSCSVRIITLGKLMQHVIFQFIRLVGRSPSDLHDLPVVTRATANLIGVLPGGNFTSEYLSAA